MGKSTLYSIGHGNKSMDVFIEELLAFGIEYLLDIRTKPYSKWNPQFNLTSLEREIKKRGLGYVFMGDSLGGLPNDRGCYDSSGKVVYDILKEKDFFKQGLDRLMTAGTKGVKLALMCSEARPEECHRSKLIGEELRRHGISLNHIISETKIKPQGSHSRSYKRNCSD